MSSQEADLRPELLTLRSIADISLLRESSSVECKLAAGRDGAGALSDEFWKSYSAFANTDGGWIVLGVREHSSSFTIAGIGDPAKLRRLIFENANNRQKVSANLLTERSVLETRIDDRSVLAVWVRRGSREQRPIYLNGNPLQSFRRLNESDCQIDERSVKRLLAEQSESTRDGRVITGFGMNDLASDTISAYRTAFAVQHADHPFLKGDEIDFLHRIGAWGRDRERGGEGPTIAGLLMFGHARAIQDEFPHYLLDYQERAEAKTELRWVDRLTLDGSWSGNLYDFFWRVYRKLVDGLKVPFALRGAVRDDDSPVHQALREALVNTLVHADFDASASVLIVKRPDLFGFRNPGRMRVPIEIARRGGEADCRNRNVHQMFRYVGLGEQAGSGVPRIFESWKGQNWAPPLLTELDQPSDQTLLRLRTIDLLPPAVRTRLQVLAKTRGVSLSALEELVLAAALTEEVVDHARARDVCGIAAFEASRLLQGLVRSRLLVTDNPGRGAVYTLPGSDLPRPNDVFGVPPVELTDIESAQGKSSEHSLLRSEHCAKSSEHMAAVPATQDPTTRGTSSATAVQRDICGRLLAEALSQPLVDSLEQLTAELREKLSAISAPCRSRAKLPPLEMRRVIRQLCTDQFVSLPALAELVDRSADALRQQHLKPMLEAGELGLAFPTTPTHPKQAYRSMRENP